MGESPHPIYADPGVSKRPSPTAKTIWSGDFGPHFRRWKAEQNEK